jgi:hypothetical protein
MHLSILSASGLLVLLGVVVFMRNAIFRRDRKYEARFPWWVRLSMYLVVLVIPPALLSSPYPDSVWTKFWLGITALAIPAIGLLGSLWLLAFGRTRERTKLGKGLLFVSLIWIGIVIGIAADPANRVVYMQLGSNRVLGSP